jgi:hypothetical protein
MPAGGFAISGAPTSAASGNWRRFSSIPPSSSISFAVASTHEDACWRSATRKTRRMCVQSTLRKLFGDSCRPSTGQLVRSSRVFESPSSVLMKAGRRESGGASSPDAAARWRRQTALSQPRHFRLAAGLRPAIRRISRCARSPSSIGRWASRFRAPGSSVKPRGEGRMDPSRAPLLKAPGNRSLLRLLHVTGVKASVRAAERGAAPPDGDDRASSAAPRARHQAVWPADVRVRLARAL